MQDPLMRRTIVIGLGGAGKLILTHLKRLMIDTYGIVPPCVKFLAMDTDAGPVTVQSNLSGQPVQLSPDEFLYMKVDQPRAFIESSENVNRWFVKPLPAGAIHNGAGAIRQVGRVAFFANHNAFRRSIDKIVSALQHQSLKVQMQNARAELGAKTDFELSENMEIYACGSLAGGTGSGTFLDVGIILRDMMPRAIISGFFLLDWVYRDKAFANRVAGNAYAALTELDYLQSVKFENDSLSPYRKGETQYAVQYGDQERRIAEPPYSLVHLVDGRNEVGENIGGVADLCDAAAHAMFLSIGSMGVAVTSVVDNLLPHIHIDPPRIWRGRNARYSSFGVSSLYYPAMELWRQHSARVALDLCTRALAEARDSSVFGAARVQSIQGIQADVDRYFQVELGVRRPNVAMRIASFPSWAEFLVQDFELADPEFPSMLRFKLENMESEIESTAEEQDRTQARPFADETQATLKNRLKGIEQNPALDDIYYGNWVQSASDYLHGLREEVSREFNETQERISQKSQNAAALLDMAKRTKYHRFWGGGRKKAAKNYETEINAYLQFRRNAAALQIEMEFLDTLLGVLEGSRSSTKDRSNELEEALNRASRYLLNVENRESKNLAAIKAKPNQVLLGNGSIVVDKDYEHLPLDQIFNVDYEDFKLVRGIHNPSNYLDVHRRGSTELPELFLDYCRERCQGICRFGAWDALDAIDVKRHEEKGEPRGDYINREIDNLFRLGAPLWSFNKSALSEVQQLQYAHILNIGLNSQEMGMQHFNPYVVAAQAKYNLPHDASYSSTGDPYTIWFINYAAALPTYLLTDHNQKRNRYYEEMTPTYHIDPKFEMEAPDLFPVNDLEARVLRVLGMAIVKGIDVILDEKLPKGHKFWCKEEDVLKEYFGDPLTWHLFRDMYDDVLADHNGRSTGSLLTILEKGLRAKVQKILAEEGAEGLKSMVEEHISKTRTKLENRDFSRLISARLTYRELKELEKFLDRRWYRMDIDSYISGEVKRDFQ